MGLLYKGSEDQGGPFWGYPTWAGASCTFWGCMMHMVGGGSITCGPTVEDTERVEAQALGVYFTGSAEI